MDQNKKTKILLSGGGTAGSVVPLLAIVNSFVNQNVFEFLWLGTKKGPEKAMVEREGIKFKSIPSGKLRRYFSIYNFIDPVFIILGFFSSLFRMIIWRPKVVLTAGSFVSVPTVWAAWLLRVPVLVHQQDALAGLANILMMPFASVITVTFEKSLEDYGEKAVWVGNPVRNNLEKYRISRKEATEKLGLRKDKPIVLVMGGGTGATAINELVYRNIEKLCKICQVVHITGKDKSRDCHVAEAPRNDSGAHVIPNEVKNPVNAVNNEILREARDELSCYKAFEFLDIMGMSKVYAVADIVVSRAGMGSLTELSYLSKPSIIIPMPDSHQEDNARILNDSHGAIVLDQKTLTDEEFVKNVSDLLYNPEMKEKLSKNISTVIRKGANKRIIEIVKRYL